MLQQTDLNINILEDYLTLRKEVVNGSSSSDLHLHALSWVPQGFILGRKSGQPVHVVQNCSWFMLFPPNMITTRPSQSAYKQATTAPTTICWVSMHIYTHLYHILFMRGACFLSLLLIYLYSILRVILLTTFLNPVHNNTYSITAPVLLSYL